MHSHAIGGDKRLLYAAGAGAPDRPVAPRERVPRLFSAGPSICAPAARHIFFELTPPTPMSFADRAGALLSRRNGRSRRQRPNSVSPGLRRQRTRFPDRRRPDAPPVELDVRVRDASGAWIEVVGD
jgi:hypothetical protein